jgi:glycosyltransferase involved in cell wall biosynthesis
MGTILVSPQPEQAIAPPGVVEYVPSYRDGFIENMVSVIMPAYNESGNIVRSIHNVKRMFQTLNVNYEIIVVDDGSIDATSLVVEDLNEDHVRIIRYPTNMGKGYAFKTGFNHVLGEYVFLIDSDCEIQPRDIRAFIKQLDHSDIAIGSKRHPMSKVQSPPMRKVFSLALRVLTRFSTGMKISDSQAGFKAAKSSSVYKIVPLMSVKRFAFDIEFLTIAQLLHMKIVELPVEIDLRKTASPSKIFRTFIDLLGITYRLRLRRWYQKNIVKASATYNPILRWH